VYDPKLDTFFSVITNGSFTKAAAELYMTPSAVLHQIGALEKELGVNLFDRTPRGVSLTKEGIYLKSHAQMMLQMDAEIRRGIRAISTDEDSMIFLLTRLLSLSSRKRCFHTGFFIAIVPNHLYGAFWIL